MSLPVTSMAIAIAATNTNARQLQKQDFAEGVIPLTQSPTQKIGPEEKLVTLRWASDDAADTRHLPSDEQQQRCGEPDQGATEQRGRGREIVHPNIV